MKGMKFQVCSRTLREVGLRKRSVMRKFNWGTPSTGSKTYGDGAKGPSKGLYGMGFPRPREG